MLTGSGAGRANRKRVLRRIAAVVTALVAVGAPSLPAWAAATSPPAAPDAAGAPPTATAVQAPPVAPQKPGAAPQRTRNAAPAANAPAANPDVRREPPTGSLRPAARQPDARAATQGAAERPIGSLPYEGLFSPSPASAPPAYRPVRAELPAPLPTPTPTSTPTASDRRAGATAETAPPPRPTQVRASRAAPADDAPLMSPLRWLFVAWGGALALGSAIRMLF